jgi:hypothetical protein
LARSDTEREEEEGPPGAGGILASDIGRHPLRQILRDLAWTWFEPIVKESFEKPKSEWSERTVRILGSYKEFKKAMGQVFGETNERQTAAGV